MFETIFAFIFGAFSYIIIILIPYIDSVNILLKITKFFSIQKPRGYRNYYSLRQSAEYKNHVKKWKKRKILLLDVYFVIFIIINIFLSSDWLSMVISFIVTLIIMAMKSNKEHFELQEIEKKIIESNIT